MKVVLIALYDIRSFGIRILHSVLEDAGFEPISIFFHENMEIDTYYTEAEIDILIDLLGNIKPDLVAFGVRSPLFKLYKKIYQKIKTKLNCQVLVGGHHPTVVPEECIKYADLVCIGEGEGPILELCQKLAKNEPLDNIQNLWVNSNGQVIKNSLRPLIANLDDIPFPSYSENNHLYIQDGKVTPNGLKGETKTNATVMTSRGCFFNCSFCYNATLKNIFKQIEGHNRYVRRRSVKNVIEEIHILRKVYPSLKEIYFSDNIFPQNKKWIDEFCTAYTQEVNLPFGCFGHFSLLETGMLQKLKKAGMYRITIGIQSGSNYINKQILNRQQPKKHIIDGSKLLSDLGIEIYYDLITNNPYETDETHSETLA